jgi:ABC-type uncharacterized transport system involved in gliding motility auxiliary subunit
MQTAWEAPASHHDSAPDDGLDDMQVTRKTRLQHRLQNALFVLLFLAVMGLLAWLSQRHSMQWDWTSGGRNTLSEASAALLEHLDGPVQITAFAREDETLRGAIVNLVERYRRAGADMRLEFINPDLAPERVRAEGITLDGELLIRHQGRSERLAELSEQALTNSLQRLARGGERRVRFLTGHGERAPDGKANFDLGVFVSELQRKGMRVESLNLAETGAVPADTAVLVVADPRSKPLPGEIQALLDYLERGGNLLWLHEPDSPAPLDGLADALGIRILPGVVVDASTRLFGISDPSFALVTQYPPGEPITRSFSIVTLFPRAAAMETDEAAGWQAAPFLRTLERSWTETGPVSGKIRYDEQDGERKGPLNIGIGLTRKTDTEPAREQRVAVIGDADFLANSYLGNGGNLQLGLNLFNWLGHDDRFIAIPPKAAPDRNLVLSRTASLLMGAGFLVILPLGLLAAGGLIWWRRHRR